MVAGKVEVASFTLPAADHPRARIFRGSTAVAIDRSTRTVFTADGDAHRYDVVVLATGSTARIPAIWGLASSAGPPAGVHALRTLDDARDIAAATVNARKAVVIGAGVLGLEAACGLARRGLSVTLIHGSATLMDRQLDPDAGVVLAHGLTKIGVDYRTGATTEEFLTGDGRVSAVRLAGDGAKVGEQIDADLVVLACGTIPEVGIALGAGLSVDRGVIVDRNLASPDDQSIFAIGDCAQPGEGASGLIAQGWEQSRRLAA